MSRAGGTSPQGEIFFEFTRIGAVVKVAAIDAASGTEVSIMGPANAPRQDLERLALAKLRRRMAASSN